MIVIDPPTTGTGDVGSTLPTLAEEIAMSAEESSRFVTGPRATADDETVAQLAADVRKLAKDYLTDAPYTLIRPLNHARDRVFRLIDERQLPRLLPGLYAGAGRLSALLAHACADLGHPYAADSHARTAWVCAEMADDDALRVYTKWVQSNTSYWTGDYATAAEAAAVGRQHAHTPADVLRLASQQARAAAAAADRRTAADALAAARDACAAVAEGPAGRDGVFDFSAGKGNYYFSEIGVTLGGEENWARAADDAQTAITLLTADPAACSEFRAAAHIDLAAARLAGDHLEGAAEALAPVLNLPVELRTAPVAGRAASIATTIAKARFDAVPQAALLRDQLRMFVAYSAARELPAA
ncbi:hypothetical protein [Actinoplanes sp. ATCC 53533]|uniref:hypothetical protein n=1 Tax=Actinoplanes sp. ATCC 53533 TaxID=1288362 RepID=UPI001F20FABD|nr:hypothetical protein [Actinoplanes sp. ATCC 53533]